MYVCIRIYVYRMRHVGLEIFYVCECVCLSVCVCVCSRIFLSRVFLLIDYLYDAFLSGVALCVPCGLACFNTLGKRLRVMLHGSCVTVCCSVLQGVAECCSLFRNVARIMRKM